MIVRIVRAFDSFGSFGSFGSFWRCVVIRAAIAAFVCALLIAGLGAQTIPADVLEDEVVEGLKKLGLNPADIK